MRLLGMQSDEGRKYSALPLPDRTKPATEDLAALLLRTAKAAEGTYDVLYGNVQK